MKIKGKASEWWQGGAEVVDLGRGRGIAPMTEQTMSTETETETEAEASAPSWRNHLCPGEAAELAQFDARIKELNDERMAIVDKRRRLVNRAINRRKNRSCAA